MSFCEQTLLRANLSLQSCRSQTYDGASNMMGKRSGIATQIQKIQPKAIVTHCHGHSLSLAVKDLTASCKVLSDTMGTVGEICNVVKFSPKREKILGSLDEMVEDMNEDIANLDVEEAALPRKRRRPKYNNFQFAEGHEKSSRNS